MLKFLIRDALIFGIIGLILGFLVDLVFPLPQDGESVWTTIVLILAQIIICVIIVYYVDKAYEKVFGYDSSLYMGFTIFVVLFFLGQIQLLNRAEVVFNTITGKHLK